MKLWILRPVNDWKPWYNKCFGFVVRAENEQEARNLASKDEVGNEGSEAWLNPSLTTCEQLIYDGEPGVLILDFHAA